MANFFTSSNKPPADLSDLLSKTVLGTNGARYQHLDTIHRIEEIDNPLYLSLQRRGKTIANVTFCKRQVGWYVRYLSFDLLYQTNKPTADSSKKNSVLKTELNHFFEKSFENGDTKLFYAYVDSENERSKQMTKMFGFKSVAFLTTQTFSRLSPRAKVPIQLVKEKQQIQDLVLPIFESRDFFSAHHLLNSEGNFYILKAEEEVIAFAKFYRANWKIHSLPGKNGRKWVRLLPYIPIIRRIINPERFSFLVPEAVWIKNNNPALLSAFFESVLKKENRKVIMWWNQSNDSLVNAVKSKVKWGLLSKISKSKRIDLVALSKSENIVNQNDEIYTVGIDFI